MTTPEPTQAELLARLVELQEQAATSQERATRSRSHRLDLWIYLALGLILLAAVVVGLALAVS